MVRAAWTELGRAGHSRRPVALPLMAIAIAGCAFPGLQTEPMPTSLGRPEPIGPVTEIGRGASLGVSWRLWVYDSTLGMCTRLELDGGGGESCGGTLGADPAAGPIGVMSVGTGTGTPSSVEGFASVGVAAVWIETNAGRVHATLMSLGAVGLNGQMAGFASHGTLDRVRSHDASTGISGPMCGVAADSALHRLPV